MPDFSGRPGKGFCDGSAWTGVIGKSPRARSRLGEDAISCVATFGFMSWRLALNICSVITAPLAGSRPGSRFFV